MIATHLKRLAFFWLASVLLATAGYYLLWLVMPRHRVFGALFRMIQYHNQYPIPYILIPCFCYGLIATALAESFLAQHFWGQVAMTVLIVILSMLASFHYGGMLWHLHDMEAGFFPQQWQEKLIKNGFNDGPYGLWVIAFSIPYNLLGAIVCFFLTRKGASLF